MEAHTLDILGFPRLCELLSQGALSPQGADACLNLRPLGRIEDAHRSLAEVQALRELEPVLGPPPTGGMQRIERDIETARKEGVCLEVESLLAVRDTVASCHRARGYLEDAAAEGSPLGALGEGIEPLYELADRFERTFGARGEVLDTASPTLRTLRAELGRVRERILKTLNAVLKASDVEPAVQDEFITLRGSRYVIPLRTDFRGYLKGIVHDRSRTGATFFVEPLEVIELNNQLGQLREEEEAEIRRILTQLTAEVGRAARPLLSNIAAVAHLDALGARVRLAKKLGAVRPELAEEPVLELRGARHPFLVVQESVEVVPVDVLLSGETRFLLITGANAGGKTVSLKTAGLITCMAMAGLFVPAAEGSRVGWFQGVYADIGDEQDIDRHLSTFSAHAAHLRDILDLADQGSLVLLDELGTGTDPQEGTALAMAVVEVLLEQDALVVGTTHLAGLKAFAYACPGGQNAAVAFDPETGRPLYRLEYGRAGTSNALEVAAQLGMPAKVMEKARGYAVGGSESEYGILLELEKAKERAVREAAEAESLRKEYEARLAEQAALGEQARRERDRVREEVGREAAEVIREARQNLRRTIRRFARRRASQQEAEAFVRETEERLEEALRPETVAPTPVSASELAPGAKVRVASLASDGVVEALEADGRKAVVRVGTLRVTVPVAELREPEVKTLSPKREQGPQFGFAKGSPLGEVVVVGCTVEDALARVDKALDQARLGDSEGLRVVHGRGTGALRRAVQEYLTRSPGVRNVRSEDDGAVTWVEVG